MAQQIEKQMTLEELASRSEAARLRLTESHARLKHKLDLPSRARESVMERPAKWLGGSLAVGFMGSFLFRKKKPAPTRVKELKRQRGFLLGLLSLAVAMGKPLAKVYATKLVRDYLTGRIVAGARARFANAGKLRY